MGGCRLQSAHFLHSEPHFLNFPASLCPYFPERHRDICLSGPDPSLINKFTFIRAKPTKYNPNEGDFPYGIRELPPLPGDIPAGFCRSLTLLSAEAPPFSGGHHCQTYITNVSNVRWPVTPISPPNPLTTSSRAISTRFLEDILRREAQQRRRILPPTRCSGPSWAPGPTRPASDRRQPVRVAAVAKQISADFGDFGKLSRRPSMRPRRSNWARGGAGWSSPAASSKSSPAPTSESAAVTGSLSHPLRPRSGSTRTTLVSIRTCGLDYLAAWRNVVNWAEVNKRFGCAKWIKSSQQPLASSR